MSHSESVMKKTCCAHGFPPLLCNICVLPSPCLHGMLHNCLLCSMQSSHDSGVTAKGNPFQQANRLKNLDRSNTTPAQSISRSGLLFDSSNTLVDSIVQEYNTAEPLNLPGLPLNGPVTSDGLIDAYGQLYGFEELAKLLYLTTPGGIGYKIQLASHWIEDWDVDHERKT